MKIETSAELAGDKKGADASCHMGTARTDLFLVSLLILLLELACIRWFPAHVLFLTFFTNTVLLASFLGMSVGCLCARHRHNFFAATPKLLTIAMSAAFGLELLTNAGADRYIDVGNQTSPEVVYFGADRGLNSPTELFIPVELINALFFLLVAIIFIGPGQRLGRALDSIPNRIQAYTLNILGSIAGILVFSVMSALCLSPAWWFSAAALLMAYFLLPLAPLVTQRRKAISLAGLLALIPVLASVQSLIPSVVSSKQAGFADRDVFWSPYYRVDFFSESVPQLKVNLIAHQFMVGRTTAAAHAYVLPHVLNHDSGGEPFRDVLIIGAGGGNDVSRSLEWGAEHIDAVEIDPVIARLGRVHHPDQPYDDPRVTVHLDDGRRFLRSTDAQYDLIVYALVDSLVLHSGYSNIRLESFLFTRQAFEDVKRRLKPQGTFVMYNFFRKGWIVARIHKTLGEVFGEASLAFSFPLREEIRPEENLEGSFTMFMAGNTDRLEQAFREKGSFWLRDVPTDPLSRDRANGFQDPPPPADAVGWSQIAPVRVIQPESPLRIATDNWPFLYIRRPMVPRLILRGMALMALLALALVYVLAPKADPALGTSWAADARMFFLGAGFMLVETRAVVHMALLFGSTWIVNSVVFFGVLVMILLANLYVLTVQPRKLALYYFGLFVVLGLGVLIPMESFLSMTRVLQVSLASTLVVAPILFAGVIFAVAFKGTLSPDRAFGFNVAGAMAGGLAENTSMLLGFQLLMLVALGFYLCSLLGAWGDNQSP